MTSNHKYQQLSYDDRRTIAIGREHGLSVRAIARHRPPAARWPATSPARTTAATFAQQRCERRRRFAGAAPKLVAGNALFEQVHTWLGLLWSPPKIAVRLAKLHPHEGALGVSHETIYNAIYAQPRGELKRELVACLRMARAKRWPRS